MQLIAVFLLETCQLEICITQQDPHVHALIDFLFFTSVDKVYWRCVRFSSVVSECVGAEEKSPTRHINI